MRPMSDVVLRFPPIVNCVARPFEAIPRWKLTWCGFCENILSVIIRENVFTKPPQIEHIYNRDDHISVTCSTYTGDKLFIVSIVLCMFCFEICTPGGRGGDKGGNANFKQNAQNLWPKKYLEPCIHLKFTISLCSWYPALLYNQLSH